MEQTSSVHWANLGQILLYSHSDSSDSFGLVDMAWCEIPAYDWTANAIDKKVCPCFCKKDLWIGSWKCTALQLESIQLGALPHWKDTDPSFKGWKVWCGATGEHIKQQELSGVSLALTFFLRVPRLWWFDRYIVNIAWMSKLWGVLATIRSS